LPNMGAFDWQTVSGALSTATHGSGIKQPAFPDMVRAIILVGSGGKVKQIEPSEGITDPSKVNPAGAIDLIQDDDLFYSTVVSFGAMGIIYELVLEVKPLFWMLERRVMTDWKDLKPRLLDGSFINETLRNNDFVSLRINPYGTGKNNTHKCAEVNQNILIQPPARRTFGEKTKNLFSTILGRIPLLPWIEVLWLNIRPGSVPNTINSILKGTQDPIYINKSHKVLYQSAVNIRRHGMSCEFAFPVDGKQIVKIVEMIFEEARRNLASGKLYQTSHIAIRFVPGSKAYLSTAYGEEKFYVDIPLLKNTIGDFEILSRYQDRMIAEGGMPHWGKINMRLYGNYHILQQHFPKLDTWLKARREMDPRGTFISEFMEHTRLI
ncbi:MAG TPA: D-arabinono-1,4-lactone oxidase, partial [Cyclobacteriaceae bacterium]|nr:D-arabinono-1,4-lactone oxidase [Cyclobacteriaceae bacterium]